MFTFLGELIKLCDNGVWVTSVQTREESTSHQPAFDINFRNGRNDGKNEDQILNRIEFLRMKENRIKRYLEQTIPNVINQFRSIRSADDVDCNHQRVCDQQP